MAFILASSVSLGDINGGAFSISASDALAVIQKQAERLASLELTDSDWQTVVAICEENIPSANDSLKSKILVSLDNDNFFVGAATLMDDLIDFYVILSANASKDAIDMMASGDSLSYARAVYTQMIENEAALRSFFAEISEELPGVGSFALSAVKAYDKEGYEEFLCTESASIDEFILSIKAFLKNPCDETLSVLNDTKCAFVAGINPVVAYVYFYL